MWRFSVSRSSSSPSGMLEYPIAASALEVPPQLARACVSCGATDIVTSTAAGSAAEAPHLGGLRCMAFGEAWQHPLGGKRVPQARTVRVSTYPPG